MSGIHLKGGGGSGHEASVEGAYGNQATDDAQTSLSKTGEQCSAHFIKNIRTHASKSHHANNRLGKELLGFTNTKDMIDSWKC